MKITVTPKDTYYLLQDGKMNARARSLACSLAQPVRAGVAVKFLGCRQSLSGRWSSNISLKTFPGTSLY